MGCQADRCSKTSTPLGIFVVTPTQYFNPLNASVGLIQTGFYTRSTMAFNALVSWGNVLPKIYFYISSGSKSPSKILRLSDLKKSMVKGYL